jgi:hypothetical protein
LSLNLLALHFKRRRVPAHHIFAREIPSCLAEKLITPETFFKGRQYNQVKDFGDVEKGNENKNNDHKGNPDKPLAQLIDVVEKTHVFFIGKIRTGLIKRHGVAKILSECG